MFFVEVGCKPGVKDVLGQAVKARLEEDLGVQGLRKVAFVDVYRLECALSPAEAGKIAAELLCDPVTQVPSVNRPVESGFDWAVTVSFHKNVTDNVGMATKEGVEDLLGRKLGEGERVYYDRKYLFWGEPASSLSEETLKEIAAKALANDMVESWKLEKGVGAGAGAGARTRMEAAAGNGGTPDA